MKQAREEHERLWKEAARLNGVDPDSNIAYSPNAERLEENSYDEERDLEGQVSNQHQSLARYPILPYSNHIKPENARSYGETNGDAVVVTAENINNLRTRFARQRNNFDEQQNEEENGEPRGFFYRFDYPVPVISDRNGRSQRLPEAQASENSEITVDYNENKSQPARAAKLQRRSFLGTIVAEEEVSEIQPNSQQESTDSDGKLLKRKSKTAETEEPQTNLKQEKSSTPQPKSEKRNTSRNRGSVRFNSKTK